MKRLLLPLLAALALPTAVNANVDPAVHNLCKDVSDYMGCVKANSKKEGWNPFKTSAKEKKSNDSEITISDEFFNYNDIDRLNKWKEERPDTRDYIFKKGFGLSFLFSPSDGKVYVTQSLGSAKKEGIAVGDQLIAAGKYNFLDSNLSLDVIKNMDKRQQFTEYMANNNSLKFKFKRGNKTRKISLSHKEYTNNETKQKEYYIAQSLRFILTAFQGGDLEIDQTLLFPEILSQQTAEFKKAYLTQMNLKKMWKEDNSNKTPVVFTHKGETYTASRTCSEGKRFYWNVEKGFLKKDKVVEIGCLSDYELQSLKNQSSGGGGGGGSGAAARMDMETKMRWNNINQNYRNDFKNWQMKEFGY